MNAMTVIEHLLEQAAENGDCYVPRAELQLSTAAVLGVSLADAAQGITDAQHMGSITLRDDLVYLPRIEQAERTCADCLKRLLEPQRAP